MTKVHCRAFIPSHTQAETTTRFPTTQTPSLDVLDSTFHQFRRARREECLEMALWANAVLITVRQGRTTRLNMLGKDA